MATIVVAIFLLPMGCSHTSKPIDAFEGTFFQNSESLNLNSSFAFTHKGDQYYFGEVFLKNNGRNCYFLLGYKNNQLKHALSTYQLQKLENIYYQNLSADQKKEAALVVIQAASFKSARCDKLNNVNPQDHKRYITTLLAILYQHLPSINFTSTFLAGSSIESLIQKSKQAKLDQVRLGMSEDKIQDLLGLSHGGTAQYSYRYKDIGAIRMVFYFKNGRLDSFVRGNASPLKEHKLKKK